MTPQEIQRNIAFIIASQAKAFGAQENTTRSHERLFHQLAKAQRQMTDLLVPQSKRMGRFDRVHEELSRDIQRLVNMILDRLPPDSVSGNALAFCWHRRHI